ncbi:MAG TPA: hypothetical protein DDY13_16255 [Cytophagales bacterium]|jgi:TetR/AcrR family transcriptional repressor of nem operon|nr:hypothetical protein [Cytophagales bacterium]
MKDTQKHILETSLQKFLEKSYKEVTLKELVEASGLSKGAFYHYFSSKEELYQKAVESYIDYMYETMVNAFDQEKSFRKNLEFMLHSFQAMYDDEEVDKASRHKQFNSYIDLVRQSMQNPVLNKKMHQFMKRIEVKLMEFVQVAQFNGQIRQDLQPKSIALQLMILIEGANLFYPFQEEDRPITDFMTEILDQYLALIEN